MINVPMRIKGPMQASELKRINQAKAAQRTRELDQNRFISGRGAPSGLNQSEGVRPAASPGATPRRKHPPATGTMLQKGQKISLSQLDPGLEQVEAGLGWDLGPGAQGYELDVEAFLLGASGRVIGDDWFVFYNQPISPDRAVRLLEPDISSSGPCDDAVIQVHLRKLDPGVTKVVLIMTISEAHEKGYHFSSIANAYVRIVNCATRRELVRFQLTDYYDNVCSMMVGEIYRYKNEWRFNPVGNGTGDDLAGLCVRYGVNI